MSGQQLVLGRDSMKQGFLWFDNDLKKEMASKVAEAIQRYKSKFGTDPHVCYVNPAEAGKSYPGQVKVLGSQAVLPNHIWIEIEE